MQAHRWLKLDVRDSQGTSEALRSLEPCRPTIVVNAAGVARDALLLRARDSDVNDLIATNLLGPIHVSRAAANMMLRLRQGMSVEDSAYKLS